MVVVLPDLVVLPVTHEASYLVIAEPPLDDGAVNATVAVGAGVNPPLFAGEVSDLQLSLA